MISSKDVLLADVTHAERLRQAEHAYLVQEAAATGRRPPAGGRWWLRVWRRDRGLAGVPVPELAGPRL